MDRKIEHIRKLIDENSHYDYLGFIMVDKDDLPRLSYNDGIFVCVEGSRKTLMTMRGRLIRYIIDKYPPKYRIFDGPEVPIGDRYLIFVCENKRIVY